MVANSSFESLQGKALDNILLSLEGSSIGGSKLIERHFGKSQPAGRQVKGKTIKVMKSRSGVRPERVGRGVQVVEYFEEVAQDSNLTTL